MRVILVLLLLLPAATGSIQNPDGEFEAKLYLHLDDMQDIQMSSLPPPSDFSQDRRGAGVTQSACIETPGQRFTDQQLHTWYAVVSPGQVQYNDTGGPVVGKQRGIGDDLHLTNRSISFEWFMRAGNAGSTQGVAPRVVVQATLREGDDISVDDHALNVGRIIAQGETAPADLNPRLAGHPHVAYDAQAEVYAFRLDLAPRAPMVVPERESFNLRVDVFTENPYCTGQDKYAMLDLVSVVSLPDHRPSLTMGLTNPVRIERIAAVVKDDHVVLEAHVRAVFGATDAILPTAWPVIAGPTEANSVAVSWGPGTIQGDRFFPQRMNEGFATTANWPFAADGASHGRFNATLRIATESGAEAVAVVPFGIGAQQQSCSVLETGEASCTAHMEGQKRTPAPLIAVPLLLAALLRRR